MLRLAVLCALLCASTVASAWENYQSGRISDVTFTGDDVLVQLDSGRPNNCSTTHYGWMMVSPEAKLLKALVLGLWLRGDAAQMTVVIYTSAVDGSGYCKIVQIDPPG